METKNNLKKLVVTNNAPYIKNWFVQIFRHHHIEDKYEKIIVGGWNSNKFDHILILKEVF